REWETPTPRPRQTQRPPGEKPPPPPEGPPEPGAGRAGGQNFSPPATPAEAELLDLMVLASTQFRRTSAALTETLNHRVRTALFRFDGDQEDEVRRYRDLLESAPGAAVVGLKRSALGCRFLAGRWERLLGLLDEEGAWYAN